MTANTNVFYNGRCVSIESMHGGIEPSIISSRLKIPNIALRIKELRKEFEGRFVFVGIDKVRHLLVTCSIDSLIVDIFGGRVSIVVL